MATLIEVFRVPGRFTHVLRPKIIVVSNFPTNPMKMGPTASFYGHNMKELRKSNISVNISLVHVLLFIQISCLLVD